MSDRRQRAEDVFERCIAELHASKPDSDGIAEVFFPQYGRRERFHKSEVPRLVAEARRWQELERRMLAVRASKGLHGNA